VVPSTAVFDRDCVTVIDRDTTFFRAVIKNGLFPSLRGHPEAMKTHFLATILFYFREPVAWLRWRSNAWSFSGLP
jgi:hypothetical protein